MDNNSIMHKDSLLYPVYISKILGIILGGIFFILIPFTPIEISTGFRYGLWLLIIVMSVTIGFSHAYRKHVVGISTKIPLWVIGSAIGGMYFLILVLLAYDDIRSFTTLDLVRQSGLTSPYWAILDGICYGALISYLTKKITASKRKAPNGAS